MTERPEERLADANVSSRGRDDRDSLTVEEIIEQLDLWRSEPPTAGATDYRELAMSLRNSKVLFALAALPALRTLINEVKERDERIAGLEQGRDEIAGWIEKTHAALPRIKQMEEALREARRSAFAIAEMADGKGQVFLKRMADELCDQIDHHVAALSPSDTEGLPTADDVRGIFEREPSDTEEKA